MELLIIDMYRYSLFMENIRNFGYVKSFLDFGVKLFYIILNFRRKVNWSMWMVLLRR